MALNAPWQQADNLLWPNECYGDFYHWILSVQSFFIILGSPYLSWTFDFGAASCEEAGVVKF